MQSFLIVSGNKEESAVYISNFLDKKEVNPIDRTIHDYEKIMGIEEVRNIQKIIFLKPFKGKEKAVVIMAYEGITLEAQNALLKVLEEPPISTSIMIAVPNKEIVLPTILSRCKIIALQAKLRKLSESEIAELEKTLGAILNGKIGDKLKIAQDLSKNASREIEKITLLIEEKLRQGDKDKKLIQFFTGLQNAYKLIKSTNVTPRTILENLFLSFA